MNELSKRIPFEGTINTRDMGGFRTEDGRHVVYRRIYRTDALFRITPKDVNRLVNEFHARWDIDFRSEAEIQRKPEIAIPGCRHAILTIGDANRPDYSEYPHPEYHTGDIGIDALIHFIYKLDPEGIVTEKMADNYRTFIRGRSSQENYGRFLRIVLENGDGSVFFHCADGKDRAGVGAALLLLTLGVAREDVIQDYLSTNDNVKGKAEARRHYLVDEGHLDNMTLVNSILELAGVNRRWLLAALDEIDTGFGGIHAYLNNQLSFSDSDIRALRDKYLK